MPGGKDLEGEAFTPDTQLYLDAYPSRPLLYHHGKDSLLGFGSIGKEVKATRKEQGIWLEGQLHMAGRYKDLLLELLGKEMLGFSSGANPGSIVKTSDGFIKSWLWNETSLTPMPANPYGIVSTKSGGSLPNLGEQEAMLSELGRLPDAGEVVEWMAEKAQGNKPDDSLERRVEALEAEMHGREKALDTERRQRETAEIEEARNENARLMEAANVTG